MITTAQVQTLTEEKIAGTDIFIVEISVKSGNKIEVLLDKESGLQIGDCKSISRHIENGLDREKEDFSLDVSSPGVGRPFRVKRQYLKDIGRTVKMETLDGRKLEGVLAAADDDKVTLRTETKEVIEGKKGKKKVERSIEIPFSEIKETKVIISFK
ncbi:MAG: ribosome assembly cofactor RimP [Crocinitomicaceae bacterium]|nr:ribosome assembly cofactor RimP [Crocinitomicaceae bacterium]